MTLRNLNQIKITSEKGRLGILANKLNEITKLPQLKNLEDSIEIGEYSKEFSKNGTYSLLCLTSEGLEEGNGYRAPNAEIGSGSYSSKKIEHLNDFKRIIKTYKISEMDMNKLYSKLTK